MKDTLWDNLPKMERRVKISRIGVGAMWVEGSLRKAREFD